MQVSALATTQTPLLILQDTSKHTSVPLPLADASRKKKRYYKTAQNTPVFHLHWQMHKKKRMGKESGEGAKPTEDPKKIPPNSIGGQAKNLPDVSKAAQAKDHLRD